MSLNTSVSLSAQQQRPRAVTVRTAPSTGRQQSQRTVSAAIRAAHAFRRVTACPRVLVVRGAKHSLAGRLRSAAHVLQHMASCWFLQLSVRSGSLRSYQQRIPPVSQYCCILRAVRLHFLLFAPISTEHCLSRCICSEIPYLSLWSH